MQAVLSMEPPGLGVTSSFYPENLTGESIRWDAALVVAVCVPNGYCLLDADLFLETPPDGDQSLP